VANRCSAMPYSTRCLRHPVSDSTAPKRPSTLKLLTCLDQHTSSWDSSALAQRWKVKKRWIVLRPCSSTSAPSSTNTTIGGSVSRKPHGTSPQHRRRCEDWRFPCVVGQMADRSIVSSPCNGTSISEPRCDGVAHERVESGLSTSLFRNMP